MGRTSVKEQLVAAAMEVFHTRGFNGCSVQDIVEAAGVPKGSFYNHFRSKEDLALEVVRRYPRSAGIHDMPASEGAALTRLRGHFTQVAASSTVAQGCLLGNFATELAFHSPKVRAEVASHLDQWSSVVNLLLVEAQRNGEISSELSAGSLSTYLVDSFEGAIARAKVTDSRAPIDGFLETTFDVLLTR